MPTRSGACLRCTARCATRWLTRVEYSRSRSTARRTIRLIFAEAGEVLSGGNFHGEPIALTLDYAAIAIADLGTISERRVERLVNPDLSGLPAFLTPDPGMNSGMMIAQIVAASLIAENSVLAHPASVTNLPTSGNKEDHVSMGMTSALKFAQVVKKRRDDHCDRIDVCGAGAGVSEAAQAGSPIS